MIGALKFSLYFTFIIAAACANDPFTIDAESCTKICESCNGTATLEDGICNCVISEDDTEAAECLKRLQKEAESLDQQSTMDQPKTGERAVRCCFRGSRKRKGLATDSNADRIVSYFLNGPLAREPSLDNSNDDCATSCDDSRFGVINPSNDGVLPAQPDVGVRFVDVAEATRQESGSLSSSYSASNRYEPIGTIPWSSTGVNTPYSPIAIASSQPYRITWYPSALTSGQQATIEYPGTMARPVPQVSNDAPKIPDDSQHTDGTESDSECAPERYSTYLNVPGASSPVIQPPSNRINTELLTKVIAHDNAILEWLADRLATVKHQKAQAPALQYAQTTAQDAKPTAQYAQPTAQNAQATAQYAQPTAQDAQATAQYAQPTTQYAQQTAQYAQPTAQQAQQTTQYAQPTTQYAQQTAQYAQPAAQYAQQTTQYAQQTAQHAQQTAQYAQQTTQYAQQPTQHYAPQPTKHYATQPMQHYATKLTQHYALQPRSEYYPDDSSIIGDQPESMSAVASSQTDTLIPPNEPFPRQFRENKNPSDNEVKSGASDKYPKDERTMEKLRRREYDESPKAGQQNRPRFSNRTKRGNEKPNEKSDS